MNNYGLKVAKSGFDVLTCDDKDLAFSSKFDTFKIRKTGGLVLSLPAETLNSATSIHTTTFAHNAGYIPIFMPFTRGIILDYTDTSDQILNDISDIDIPKAAYGISTPQEVASIYADENNLTLEVFRINDLGFDQTFVSHNVYIYYIIYYNQLNEVFDLNN